MSIKNFFGLRSTEISNEQRAWLNCVLNGAVWVTERPSGAIYAVNGGQAKAWRGHNETIRALVDQGFDRRDAVRASSAIYRQIVKHGRNKR